jgi:hypothetical protein
MSARRFKMNNNIPSVSIPEVPVGNSKVMTETVKATANVLSKWIPLICAGAAVGVSIIALKEIKNVRKEVLLMKKEQLVSVNNTELTEKIERMDEQLRRITEYLTNQNKMKPENNTTNQRKQKKSKKNSDQDEKIINQVLPKKMDKVNIINDEPDEDDNEVEIEIEVTDDEEDQE